MALLSRSFRQFCSSSAAMAPILLGPPEIHHLPLPPRPLPAAADHPPSDPFLDLMDARFNAPPFAPPIMGFTENLSPTILHSPAAMAPILLGPPEIHHLPPPPRPLPAAADHPPSDPFFDLKDARFNAPSFAPPMRSSTENLSLTFLSSGDPCLDFFFKVVPDTPAGTVTDLLAAAWAHDAPTALKLVAHLRGVRGTGKSDRKGFYAAALWLHAHHPKTLALNVAPLARSGYIKDLPEILCRLVVPHREPHARRCCYPLGDPVILWPPHPVAVSPNDARKDRRRRRAELAGKVVARYSDDPDYQFLHDRVADFFAGLLAEDAGHLRSGRIKEISLAAKWCPSLDSSYDRATLLCESVARRLFPRNSDSEYEGLDDAHYAYRVRDRLRKEVLTPIRAALELPEVFMCSGGWTSLRYACVASVAMKNYRHLFMKHDKERITSYLGQVKAGRAKIASGALFPHEILCLARAGEHDEVSELQWQRTVSDLLKQGRLQNSISVCDVSCSMIGTPMDVCIALGLLVSELSADPWKGRVITFSANPSLQKITGDTLVQKAWFVKTMEWGPNTDFQKVFDRILAVAVEARLPPSQMVKRVFVFSDMEFDKACETNSEADIVSDDASACETDNESDEAWGWETDNESDKASACETDNNKSDEASSACETENESNLEFHDASENQLETDYEGEVSKNKWETDYQAIRRKFDAAGYGAAVPELVFWNLRDSHSIPVKGGQKGVALVSGFSKNLLKLFLDGDGIVDPLHVMSAAISGEEYSKLVVFD